MPSEEPKSEKKIARKWLKSISLPAQKWVKLTIIIAFANQLLLIYQLYLLSHIAYTAYLKGYAIKQLSISFISIIVIVLIRALLSWLREIVSYQSAVIVKKQLREDILNHVDKLGPVRLSQVSNANIISSAMEQVEGLTGFITKFLPQVTLAGILPFIILIFVFQKSIVAGVILLITAPLIPILMIIIGLSAESENQKHFKALTRMSSTFLDTIKGLTTLKLFNKSKMQSDKIFQASDNYRIRTMRVLKIAFLSAAVLEFFAAASIALVAIYLGMGFINAGADINTWWSLKYMTLQDALFILLLAPEFFMPLRELSVHYHAKAEAVGAALEIQKIFDIEPPLRNEKQDFNQDIQSIDIKNLSVKYGEKVVINNLSLNIQKQEKIAIVGASGAGKTTLINTLLGFIEYQGNIIVNNDIELSNIDDKYWLKNISWLGQNANLFKGSIRDNLSLANKDSSDEDFKQAIKKANLDEFINSLPNSLDTQIGEQNLGLSGGQAQRLALARAYLKPHNLLILDEPTASLDKDTETKVIQSLKANWQDKTVIMLTHKLNFLECVDRIIVLENGQIIQQGNFDELVKKQKGAFYNFYKNEVNI